MTLLDKLVNILGDAGLKLNVDKKFVDHNIGPATTVFDYFDWGRYQGKGNGIRSQMVRLHVVCSRFQTCNSGFWLWFTMCEPRKCQQMHFSEQKCIHQIHIEIL